MVWNTIKSIKSGLKTRLARFKNRKFSYPGEGASPIPRSLGPLGLGAHDRPFGLRFVLLSPPQKKFLCTPLLDCITYTPVLWLYDQKLVLSRGMIVKWRKKASKCPKNKIEKWRKKSRKWRKKICKVAEGKNLNMDTMDKQTNKWIDTDISIDI